MLLVVSVIIVFTVIKPKFSEISYYQNEMATYQTALDNIGRYNQRLQNLINQANAMSSEDRDNLFRYLPESVDSVAISRDIENMINNNKLILTEISTDEPQAVTSAAAPTSEVLAPTDDMTDDLSVEGVAIVDSEISASTSRLISQDFTVNVFGRYEDMKSFLKDLERNVYPLRLVEFEFTVEEDGPLVEYKLVLQTYAYGLVESD